MMSNHCDLSGMNCSGFLVRMQIYIARYIDRSIACLASLFRLPPSLGNPAASPFSQRSDGALSSWSSACLSAGEGLWPAFRRNIFGSAALATRDYRVYVYENSDVERVCTIFSAPHRRVRHPEETAY